MAGNWVFLDGVDTTIAKMTTNTSFTEDSTGDDAIRIFRLHMLDTSQSWKWLLNL